VIKADIKVFEQMGKNSEQQLYKELFKKLRSRLSGQILNEDKTPFLRISRCSTS